MRGSGLGLLLLGTLALNGCSTYVEESKPEDDKQAIVRAKSDGGKDQVVLLYVQTLVNGQLRTRTCSATYYHDRVVLTAAHCLENAWENHIFVYWGNDFATDFAALPVLGGAVQVPAPGEGSPFAQADSFEAHPKWDAEQIHPDVAVVYLDRKLPFQPLPLANFRLDQSFVNKAATLVGWGASQSLTADLSQTVGGRIQRTGKTRILGSPTAADYHPEDPNPGMLVPRIRRDTLKTDGHAPYANSCAGDSGGPLLVQQGGRDYIGGVGSWTGLWCEDYSLFARIDPVLPFLRKAEKRAGEAPLKARLDCVAPNADGSYTAFFGYENENGVHLDVPYGEQNQLALDTSNRRPRSFAPGRHDFVFGVEFSAKQTVSYELSPDSCGGGNVVRADKRSRRCGEDVATQVACGGLCRAGLAAGCPDALPSYTQCLNDCVQVAGAYPECAAESLAMNQCYAATPPGEDHWLCNGDDFMPSSFDCGEAENAFYTCLFGGF